MLVCPFTSLLTAVWAARGTTVTASAGKNCVLRMEPSSKEIGAATKGAQTLMIPWRRDNSPAPGICRVRGLSITAKLLTDARYCPRHCGDKLE